MKLKFTSLNELFFTQWFYREMTLWTKKNLRYLIPSSLTHHYVFCPASFSSKATRWVSGERRGRCGEIDGDGEIAQCSSSRLSEQGVNRQGQRLGSEFPIRVDLWRLLPQGLRAPSTSGPFWALPAAPHAPPNFLMRQLAVQWWPFSDVRWPSTMMRGNIDKAVRRESSTRLQQCVCVCVFTLLIIPSLKPVICL